MDVVVADAAGGRDAQVVYYCCPRRRREDASWRGECIERHQQFVCLSRVRQRMYIFLEDFTNTTRVNPRSSKFFSEAVSYGAIRCDCQNGCDRCGRSDKQIVLLRLAHWCRKRVRQGSYINTKTYAVSSSVWPGPYSRWGEPCQKDVQAVYEEAWAAHQAAEWWNVRLPSCCVSDRRQDRPSEDAQWFSPEQLGRPELVALLQSKYPQCRAVYQPVNIPDLGQLYRFADTADLRRAEEKLVRSYWGRFTINAMGVHIQSATHIVIGCRPDAI